MHSHLGYPAIAIGCDPGFQPVGTKCIKFIQMSSSDWYTAQQRCASINASLIVFNSATDMQQF